MLEICGILPHEHGRCVMTELIDRQEEIFTYVAGLLKEAAYRAGSKMLDFLILPNGGAAVACWG
jgi:hypothetical protein